MGRMQAFALDLPYGSKTTGLLCLPAVSSDETIGQPLVVTIHGGTYTASYYDADDRQSISSVSKRLGVPVVCVTRPGYGKSSAQPENGGETLIQQQGRYFHEVILPEVWTKYGGFATSIVLHAHSVGGAVAIVTAANYSNDSNPKYPMSGIITSGVSHTPLTRPSKGESGGDQQQRSNTAQEEPKPEPGAATLWPIQVKDSAMLSPEEHVCSEAIFEKTEALNSPIPVVEQLDIRDEWPKYWKRYAGDLKVPHLHAMPEHDRLWTVNPEVMDGFAKAFGKCPRMETSIVQEAPHCIELSHQGQGWYAKTFGFAMECAVAMELKKRRSA